MQAQRKQATGEIQVPTTQTEEGDVAELNRRRPMGALITELSDAVPRVATSRKKQSSSSEAKVEALIE